MINQAEGGKIVKCFAREALPCQGMKAIEYLLALRRMSQLQSWIKWQCKQKSLDWSLLQTGTKRAWHSSGGWGDGVFVAPTLDSVSDLMQLLWRNPIPTTANVPSLGILIPIQEYRLLSLVLWISSKLGVYSNPRQTPWGCCSVTSCSQTPSWQMWTGKSNWSFLAPTSSSGWHIGWRFPASGNSIQSRVEGHMVYQIIFFTKHPWHQGTDYQSDRN